MGAGFAGILPFRKSCVAYTLWATADSMFCVLYDVVYMQSIHKNKDTLSAARACLKATAYFKRQLGRVFLTNTALLYLRVISLRIGNIV